MENAGTISDVRATGVIRDANNDEQTAARRSLAHAARAITISPDSHSRCAASLAALR